MTAVLLVTAVAALLPALVGLNLAALQSGQVADAVGGLAAAVGAVKLAATVWAVVERWWPASPARLVELHAD